MKDIMKISNLSRLKNYQRLEFRVIPNLLNSLGTFFCAKTMYDKNPIEYLKEKYNIDITLKPNRGIYIVEEEKCCIIVCRCIMEGNITYAFSIEIFEVNLKDHANLLSKIESTIAAQLSGRSTRQLAESYNTFGDALIERSITNFVSKGVYNRADVHTLIELFHKLSTSNFENKNFTTGMILTKSYHDFLSKKEGGRPGNLCELKTDHSISSSLNSDKRFWYLVDGKRDYYLVSPDHGKLRVSNIFHLDIEEQPEAEFISEYSLINTIKGRDVLFRVTGNAEFSITTQNGLDFNYKEGRWLLRDFKQAMIDIRTKSDLENFPIESLLNYVLSISEKRLSSIIWIPYDHKYISTHTQSLNTLSTGQIAINNSLHKSLMMRLLTSDGVTILSKEGKLISYATVITSNGSKKGEIKGSGERLAEHLSQHGLSIKVSQDGSIKIFSPGGFKINL